MCFLVVSKTLSNSLLTHCAVWQFASHSAHTFFFFFSESACLWRPQAHPTPVLPRGTSIDSFAQLPFIDFSFGILLTHQGALHLFSVIRNGSNCVYLHFSFMFLFLYTYLISAVLFYSLNSSIIFHILESGMSSFASEIESEKWLFFKK